MNLTPTLTMLPPSQDQRVFILWAHQDRHRSEEQIEQYKQTVVHFAHLMNSIDGLQVEVDLFHYDDKNIDFTRWGPLMVEWADSVIMIASDALWERWSGRNPS